MISKIKVKIKKFFEERKRKQTLKKQEAWFSLQHHLEKLNDMHKDVSIMFREKQKQYIVVKDFAYQCGIYNLEKYLRKEEYRIEISKEIFPKVFK